MFKSIKEFLENLFKTGRSGITTTEQATEAARKLKEASEESVKKTGLGDPALTGKYDETTPPGQFKEQTPIIDEEGNVVTRTFSYNPETFTETQMRTGVGSFSDDALTERYEELRKAGRLLDEGYDDAMTLEEFIIKERNITPEARAAELREKGRILSTETAVAKFEEAADDMVLTNQGRIPRAEYEILKARDERLGITGGEKIKLIEEGPPSNEEILKNVTEQGKIESAADTLTVQRKIDTEEISYVRDLAKATGRDPVEIRRMIADKMNAGYAPGDPKRVAAYDTARIKAYIETQTAMDGKQFIEELIEETMELPRAIDPTGDPILDDLIRSERAALEEGRGVLQTIREDADKVRDMLINMGIDVSDINFDIIKNSDDFLLVKEEAAKLQDAMKSIMGGSMDELAKSGNIEKAMKSLEEQVMADIARGKAALEKARTPAEGEAIISDLQKIEQAYQDAIKTGVYKPLFGAGGRTLNATGGRIGFDEGGGPKMSRRGFLGAMGAGLASLFMPRAGKEIAEIVAKGATKTPLTAEGMPIWFPSLVDKIRKEGKLRKADYASMKSGEGVDMYTFTDPSLPNKQIFMEEDLQTGAITISGRGDDMQIAELRFIPGQENIQVGSKGTRTTKEPNAFEAEEFMKGPGEGIGDYENFGGMDDLRFGVDSWAGLVKSPEQKLKEAADKFGETQRNPTPNVDVDEFAKGGRVGYNMGGGVQTLFRRKAS